MSPVATAEFPAWDCSAISLEPHLDSTGAASLLSIAPRALWWTVSTATITTVAGKGQGSKYTWKRKDDEVPSHIWGDTCQMGKASVEAEDVRKELLQPPGKSRETFSKKVTIGLLSAPAASFPGIYPKNTKQFI